MQQPSNCAHFIIAQILADDLFSIKIKITNKHDKNETHTHTSGTLSSARFLISSMTKRAIDTTELS